jgi:perosamine synthetase
LIKPKHISAEHLARVAHLLPGEEPRVQPAPREYVPDGAAPYIAVAGTDLGGNERRYLNECVSSNWISSQGPFVERFEEAFAGAVGCRCGVACSSGTSALHLALAALGIGEGDEVIVPAFTMIATANAVRYTGARPVLVDAEAETWNIDPAQIEARITPRTRAVIVAHIYGHPADMASIVAVARRHGLYVVEDAAEAPGATYQGSPVGSLGDVAAFSFYANKIVSTGEGGMVTSNDPQIAELARRLRDHAFSEDRHFWHAYVGYNYRMSNLQAAVGLAQTERFSDLVQRRRANKGRYSARLGSVTGLALPGEREGVRSVYWMYGVLVDEAFGMGRDELREWLAQRGVETRTFFVPIHLQPIYFERFKDERFPVSESLCQKGLYLPSGPLLTDEQIAYIAQCIEEAAQRGTAASAPVQDACRGS